MEWNVIVCNFNKRCIESFNVFSHHGFAERVKEIYATSDSLAIFVKELESAAQYYFWSKCEYEILVCDWVTETAKTKFDVYSQLMMNFERFSEYCWRYLNERHKEIS